MCDIERFRSGDRVYFDEVMTAHTRMVMHVVASFAVDSDHADDLFQEVWMKTFEKASTYTGVGSIASWIYGIARNICVSEHRSRKVRRDHRTRFAVEADAAAVSGWRPLDPATAAEKAEQDEILGRAVRQLSPRQHETLTLSVTEGLSTREVADLMGVNVATVRSNLRHAVQRLRTILEDPGEDLPRYRSTN